MKVDCYNILYTDFAKLCGGDTFWYEDNLYMVAVTSVDCNAVNLSNGVGRYFHSDDRVIRACTKIVCDD